MSRLTEPPDPDFDAINRSLDVDRRLWPYDIAQSRAHVRMLASSRIIPESDAEAILSALDTVHAELAEERFGFQVGDEDIHMAIERRVTELAGDAGARMHTARSRNDQVATDLAMFTREAASETVLRIEALMRAVVAAAEAGTGVTLPGYTHLQRAQPVYLAHHLLAYFWMLDRDRDRFRFAKGQCSALPLGAGALAGVNFDTDRPAVAADLGFETVSPNSLDAVSNRDFVLDFLSAAATCSTHLSRLGSELVIWSSQEFGFVELPDSWTSGSSLMPQKKNPDAAELLRAKAPRVVGHLAAFHGVMHALPLAYNKDLQEDKENLFDAADTLAVSLAAAEGMIAGARFDSQRMAEASADDAIAATDLADLLVRRGVPFRDAHGIVGSLVGEAAASGRRLSDLDDEELLAVSEHFDDGARELLSRSSWTESKTSQGGTASDRVAEQLEAARRVLDEAG